MQDAVVVEISTALPADVERELRAELGSQRTMERALRWFFAQSPPLAPADLVPQDEFSYDLIVPYRDGLCLSYAT